MSDQHGALAAAAALSVGAVAWLASGRAPARATGTVQGTVDCSTPAGAAEACPSVIALELVDAAGTRFPVTVDRSQEVGVFSVDVPAGLYTVVGNGSPVPDADGRPLTVQVTPGVAIVLHLSATPLALGA